MGEEKGCESIDCLLWKRQSDIHQIAMCCVLVSSSYFLNIVVRQLDISLALPPVHLNATQLSPKADRYIEKGQGWESS